MFLKVLILSLITDNDINLYTKYAGNKYHYYYIFTKFYCEEVLCIK